MSEEEKRGHFSFLTPSVQPPIFCLNSSFISQPSSIPLFLPPVWTWLMFDAFLSPSFLIHLSVSLSFSLSILLQKMFPSFSSLCALTVINQ